MSNPLKAILTFHLKDGREYTDESAIIKKINKESLTMSSMKPFKVKKDEMDNATVMILHGNSSRLLFSVTEMEKDPVIIKDERHFPGTEYTFLPPVAKSLSLPDGGNIIIPCSGYSKLMSITKPKNVKKRVNTGGGV